MSFTAHAATLPDSTQTFNGYIAGTDTSTRTSPDGFFTLRASAGKLSADEYGAYIEEESGNKITSYLEIKGSMDLCQESGH
jgi:hypothetical protein